MTRIGWVLKVGPIATALATVSLSLSSTAAAQQLQPGVIVLASTSQVLLERANDGPAIPGEIVSSPGAAAIPQSNVTPVFVPRIRHGAPASRIGGATRGRETQVTIKTLVPEFDEAALTLAAQPNLYFHLSADTPHPVNFTLLDPELIDPMIDVMISGPFKAGFHVLSLADYKARLESGRNYEWFVAVVPSPDNRSADSVARGAVSRVDDPDLASRAAKADPSAAAGLFARSGIWYETLDALDRRIRQSPADRSARSQRTAMLEQVGLVLSQD